MRALVFSVVETLRVATIGVVPLALQHCRRVRPNVQAVDRWFTIRSKSFMVAYGPMDWQRRRHKYGIAFRLRCWPDCDRDCNRDGKWIAILSSRTLGWNLNVCFDRFDAAANP